MNIIPNAKWIECRSDKDLRSDPINPWEGVAYSPRPKNMERQFQPIANAGGTPMFRRSFHCTKSSKASITATALGIYNLWCNGHRVGAIDFDGDTVYDEFNPGATVYSKRVMATTYDLSKYLVDGENVILAVVAPGWWRGTIFYDTYGEGMGMAFCAELKVDGKSIPTDNSCKTHWGGPVRAADIYHGEIYNANFDSYETISKNDFDALNWDFATEWHDQIIKTPDLEHIPRHSTPINELNIVPFVGPAVRIRKHLSKKPLTVTVYDSIKDNGSDFGEINTVRIYEGEDGFSLKKGETAIIDFGQNIVALPDFYIKASKGTFVQIRVGEMLNDSGMLDRGNDNPKGSLYTINYRDAKSKAYYIARGDEKAEHYRSMFTFFGFRYLEISATDSIDISALTACVVGSDIEEIGDIETSSNDINKLISNIKWGQRGNYLSIPTDCPQRDERQGWTGDTQFFCKTGAYNANVLEFFRKWLADARDSQHENGAFQDVIPMVRHWGYGGAAWADAPLLVACTMLEIYGDTDIIEENIDAFEKYMTWMASREVSGPAPTYGDWLAYDKIDSTYISKAYYALDALAMSMMYYAIGNWERCEDYNDLYFEIRDDFRNAYIGEDGDLLPEYRKQTGYLLAFHTYMFDPEEMKAAADALEKIIVQNGYKLSTGFVGTPLLCTVLSEIGKSNTAYSLLLQTDDPSWLYSVHQGATTIWERWNSYTIANGFGDVSMNSFNHYSFGAVMEWMYRFMVGIQSLGFGFEGVKFTPQPDTRNEADIPHGQEKITWVKGSYKIPSGIIKSEWEMKDGVFKYFCSSPVKAEIIIPNIPGKSSVIIDGKKIAISDLRTNMGDRIIDIECGEHTLEI